MKKYTKIKLKDDTPEEQRRALQAVVDWLNGLGKDEDYCLFVNAGQVRRNWLDAHEWLERERS